MYFDFKSCVGMDTASTLNALIMLTENVFRNFCVLLMQTQPQSELESHSPKGTWTSSWICLCWCSWPPWGSWRWGRGAALRGTSRWRQPGRGSEAHLRWWRTAPAGERRVRKVVLMSFIPDSILSAYHFLDAGISIPILVTFCLGKHLFWGLLLAMEVGVPNAGGRPDMPRNECQRSSPQIHDG